MSIVSPDKPRVFYGYDKLPGPNEMAFGGIVKIQDLQRYYPNHPKGANLLYLVSSALPHFAVRMAKMAKKAGVRIVVNQNGVAYPGWYGPGWDKFNRSMKQLLHIADYVIYQSEFCKVSADRFLGVREGPSEILYNSVDTEIFVPSKEAKREDDGIKLLLSGSHWTYYRLKIALETLALVLKECSEASLIIAGRFCWEKNERVAIEQVMHLVRELNVDERVSLIGPYSQSQAVSVLQDAHILLHTKYNDPCPRLVAEAMACGLPIVFSATGGVPELVGDSAGIGVLGPIDWEKDHPPDPQKLSAAVLDIMHNIEQYAEAARKRAVKKLDVRNWLKRHSEIFGTF